MALSTGTDPNVWLDDHRALLTAEALLRKRR